MTGCSVPHNRGESELAYPGNRPIHSPGGAINDRGQVSAQRWRGRGPVCPQWLMIVPVEFAGTAEVQRRGGTRTRILITYLNLDPPNHIPELLSPVWTVPWVMWA